MSVTSSSLLNDGRKRGDWQASCTTALAKARLASLGLARCGAGTWSGCQTIHDGSKPVSLSFFSRSYVSRVAPLTKVSIGREQLVCIAKPRRTFHGSAATAKAIQRDKSLPIDQSLAS